MADKIIKIVHDSDCDCPMDWDYQWTLHSFDRNSIHENQEYNVDNLPIGIRRKLQVGTAFLLNDNGDDYSIRPLNYSGWRQPGGILLWEHPPKELRKSYAERMHDAEVFLNTYNDWRNGRCVGYMVETVDGEHLDSCFGYFESDAKYMSECAVASLAEGDRVKIAGDFADVFDRSALPANVEEVEDFDETDAA